jgi:hypothetical protein
MHGALASFAVALMAATSPLGRISENTTAYHDAVGEDIAAPDITSVKVSNDAGVIPFRVEIPKRPTLTDDMRVYVTVDADSDRCIRPVDERDCRSHVLLRRRPRDHRAALRARRLVDLR